MKPRRTLPWVALMAIIVLGLAVPGSASATTLCETNTTPCTSLYPSGTTIKGKLAPATSITIDGSFVTVECDESNFSATTDTNGGLVTVTAPTSSLTFEECNYAVEVKKAGTLEIHHNSGGMSGTVRQNGSEISVSTSVGTCVFTTNNTSIGTLLPSVHLGGGFYLDAELRVGGYVPRTGGNFLCGSWGYFEGSYLISSPTPLFVSNA